ncbi:MAG TPA: MFS transporter [Clostridiales bacterium]|nr:MFS transporter [Clostridiales bacterium]
MVNKGKALPVKLSLFYIFQYAALASFTPYLTYYFQQKGLSYTQIGILLAISSLVGVFAQPAWGSITDKYLNNRVSLMVSMLIAALAMVPFMLADEFYVIALFLILLLCFQSPVMPLGDAYTYEIIEQHSEMQYGKIRLMGSIGYAVTAFLIGNVANKVGIQSAFIIFSFLMVLGAVTIASVNVESKTVRKRSESRGIIKLLKNREFILFLAMTTIVNVSFGINSNYVTILVQETGGNVANLGVLWFVLAISELPVLYFANRLMKKLGDMNVILIGVGLFILRYFFSSLCSSYIAVIGVQLLQSVTFPLFLIGVLNYLNRTAPPNMKTSAMTLYSASGGIGIFIGNAVGGVLLESISIFSLYRIITLVSVIGLLLALGLKKINLKSYE